MFESVHLLCDRQHQHASWAPYHTNTVNDTMLSPFFQFLTLRNWPAVHIALFVLFVCGCCFAGLLFSWFGSSGIVTAIWSVLLVLCQFNFCSLPSMKMHNVTALINELTNMQHAI